MITHSAKETRQQKEQLGIGVGSDMKVGGEGGDKIGSIGNIGGLHKGRGLAPLCQLYKEGGL